MVEIELNTVDGDYHMVASNGEGNEVHLDASPSIGGTGKGMRPMQLLLASLAGCSTIDVISILKKQRQSIQNIKARVEGVRDDKAVPSPFQKINLHFILNGDIELMKAEKAVALSVEKYCSVAATLDKTISLTFSCEVVKK